MARPPVITDEQILEAARAVFLERGFGATTAEVARRAGVAEGSVFKRFATKHKLFSCAMVGPGAEPPWFQSLRGLMCQGDVRKNLVTLGITIVEFFRQILPIMMMSWSNPGPDGLPEILSQENPPPLRVIVALTAFFENEMKAGRMRKRDPQVVARAYLGGLQSYVFFEVLLRRHRLASLSAENHVKALVDLLWQGLEPVKKKGSGK